MKLGSTALNLNSVSIQRIGATQHSTEEEITVCAISRRSHGRDSDILGWERCCWCDFLAQGDNNILSQLYWNIMKCDCLLLGSSSHKKKNHVLFPHEMPDCAQLCAPLRPSPNLDGQLLDLRYSSDLTAVEFYLFIPLKDRMPGCYYGDVKAL
jgi:hypothetical protein